MNQAYKRWLVTDPNPELSSKIGRALNISPLVSQLLINRGFDSPELAHYFLSPTLHNLHSPFLMKDMQRAVERISAALKNNEKICIYGDYDVDGITATAIVMLFLQELQAEVFFYIPSRLNERYGLNISALKQIKQQGASLIITVDCGVSDFEEITYAHAQGIDVIVTDHHEIPDRLPPAYAIVNPKQPDCAFPFKGLAGVGVAFNCIMALRKSLRDKGVWHDTAEPNLKKYFDLVAMGTIADIVPMVDENRIFVKNGLELISEGTRPGIKALKSVSGISNGEVTSTMIGYRLAPRMNASGRLSDAGISVQLLLTTNTEEAFMLAHKIDEENNQRQQIERRILTEAKAMLPEKENLPWAIVLHSTDWHLGVIGLCASRLSDQYNRPTILIAVDEKTHEGRGSARSIPSFDIYSALKQCESELKAFGGHKTAAGLTIPLDNINPFSEKFNTVVQNELREEDFTPVINIDAEIPLGLLSYDIIEEIENLAPFGPANPEPVFCTNPLRFYSSMIVGNGHLKLKIKQDGRFFDAIGFNMGSTYSLKDETIRLAFVPQFNFFNGEKIIQLNLKDIKV